MDAASTFAAGNFLPNDRAQLETDDTVEDLASLLGLNEAHVNGTRLLNGFFDGRLCNLVEHDTVRFNWVEPEHFTEVPGDSLSLAVFIGCKPDGLGSFDSFLELSRNLFLVRVDFKGSSKAILDIDWGASIFWSF